MFIETPNPPDGNESEPPDNEWLESQYEAWTNNPPPEEDFEPPGNYNVFVLELLEVAHEKGLIDNSDILALGVGEPEIIKSLKDRAAEQGRDFQEIFKGFDIS